MNLQELIYRGQNALHNLLYRLTGGKVGGTFAGARVLLLTTRGRKSGRRRTTPLIYVEDGDRLALVASKGGSPRHPGWFLNLKADPAVVVQVGPRREHRRARVATEEERARLWPRALEAYPMYGRYQEKTARRIPVVILEKE